MWGVGVGVEYGCGVWVWSVGVRCMINVATSDDSMKGWKGGRREGGMETHNSTRNQQIAFTSLK